jgi:hypothetical protein
MVPLKAVPTFQSDYFWVLDEDAGEEGKGKEAGDPRSASAVADSPGAAQDDATWSDQEDGKVKQEEVKQEEEEQEEEDPWLDPEPLVVFPRVKQKVADIRWMLHGVHQIVLWVGNPRPGRAWQSWVSPEPRPQLRIADPTRPAAT